MKKLFAIFLVVFALGACSSSDDDGNNSSNSQITPPSWIQGDWYLDNDYYTYGYRFTHDDICQLQLGGVGANCMKETINIYHGTQIVTKVDQQISDTEYKCVITIGGQVLDYHFRKVSPYSIELVTSGQIFVKQ